MSCHTPPKRPALAPDDRRREVIAIMARACVACVQRPVSGGGQTKWPSPRESLTKR